MNKKLFLLIAAGLSCLLAGLAAKHLLLSPQKAEVAARPQVLFASKFPDANGKVQALAQWQGQIAIINFWATWCAPCREEMPELSQLHQKYAAQGVTVIGIATDDVAKIREFVKNTPVSYPLLAGDFTAMDLGESLGNNRGVLPYTVVIDRQGKVAKTYFGRVNQALLEQTLVPLLYASAKTTP